ncbi:hypothetical protein MIND_01319900 [Mycena indigotica]|uniref:Mannoprotein n=1 Tax=Mycena indigotica TaxID=2126181 RepID=A0A8H6S219_9AGAR|nr:uncharacterized protein MIND_01319900 [Mycena indigotica]KAF7290790.1 hypothetical protein MIND_01319900 [Mycena indigotica]
MFPALLLIAASLASVNALDFPKGVIATGTMGVTNPPKPTMGTPVNQQSMARLISLNAVDDFCLFAPPEPNSEIGETEDREVAWCTKPRNNARLIPDGVITGVSFLKTPFYVQVMGTGDFTKLNIRKGDAGGELDPHGATGAGNPAGGNVTTNIVDGKTDLNIEEWMMFISDSQFCVRACTNANATYDAAHMCWHQLDVMGCEFVMPGTYKGPGTFETCDADVAYPPGWYPGVDASGKTTFSTFAQYFTGVYTGGDGKATGYTVGDLVTPTTVAFIPKSSNCVTTATIGNAVAVTQQPGASSAPPPPNGSSKPVSGSAPANPTKSGSVAGSQTNSGSRAPPASSGSSAAFPMARLGGSEFFAIVLVSLIAGIAGIGLLH